MMKFEYWKYNIRPLTLAGGLNSIQDRIGAIFRVTWPNGKFGYADIMPRPEYGDIPIDHEIENLRRFKMSNLAEQMITLAKEDADVRFEKRNVFKGARRVKNNYFVPDVSTMTLATINQIKDQNFTSIMVDCGQDWDAELHSVKKLLKHSGLMVRLDFNAKADFSIFERFMTNIEPSTRARIEYVEDPMPFEPESWRDASRLVSLGVESQYSQIPWDSPEKIPPIRALVIRPSRIDANLAVQRALANKMKIVITSSLEHPVSIAHASYLASRLTAKDPTVLSDHDCLYQTFFAPHTFSGTLNSQGPFLSSLDGYGIGFDLKFMTLQWTLLR